MDDEADRRNHREQAHRWPRNRQRDHLYQLVRGHDGAVDAATLADRVGLHVTTVRFHLDSLCDEGAVVRTRIKHTGVGRPRTGYIAVPERLDYQVLAEVLAEELGDTHDQRERRARHAGQRWAERMAAAAPAGTPEEEPAEDPVTATTRLFERMGFAPELAAATGSEQTIRLHSCPVRELARSHPEVSCGMHLGLLRGVLGNATGEDAPAPRASLTPLVEPNLCIATVTTDD